MSRKIPGKLSPGELQRVETCINAFLARVPQVVVQSRFGGIKKQGKPGLSENDIFEIAIEHNKEIAENVKAAYKHISLLKEFCICIEISIKTAEGDSLLLELWSLRLERSTPYWDSKYRVYAELEIVFRNLLMLLKSVIAVTRVIPAFKLSLGQSAQTYVVLYKIYEGDPQYHQLGNNPEVNKIGEVYTPIGTVSVSVAYRTKNEMTISPQNSEKENSFMVKSNYFDLTTSPKSTRPNLQITEHCVLQNATNSPKIGALATRNISDPSFSELAFLQKTFLHPTRSCLSERNEANGNVEGDMNSNVNENADPLAVNDQETCERLSASDLSDGSDFVFIEMKPPFSNQDLNTDLNAFYKECQCAPSLSSFSQTPSLQEQVLDVTSQLEKFEISMMDFDQFVDSVCQVDTET